MYFRSRGVITDEQLILGLGIQLEERPGDDADSEAPEPKIYQMLGGGGSIPPTKPKSKRRIIAS
jgi:hypothetical protein